MKKITIMLILLCVIVFAQQKGTFTDSRDGKTYNYVKIGEKVWMAQNLDYHGEDGYLGLCYEDKPKEKISKLENCEKYGRLYDWNEAMKACPFGWHLPSNNEWSELYKAVGGEGVAGRKLKAKSGWKEHDFSGKSSKVPKCKWTENMEEQIDNRGRVISPARVIEYDKCPTDEYGFSALPSGYGNSDGGFDNVGSGGNWWSSSGYGPSYDARYWGMSLIYYYERVLWSENRKSDLCSIRCVKD